MNSINNDPRIHGLEIDEVDSSQVVACPIPSGGATIHHCRTVHYAGPNKTAEARRAYILIFAVPLKQRAVPRDFYWQREKQTARETRRKAAQTTRNRSM